MAQSGFKITKVFCIDIFILRGKKNSFAISFRKMESNNKKFIYIDQEEIARIEYFQGYTDEMFRYHDDRFEIIFGEIVKFETCPTIWNHQIKGKNQKILKGDIITFLFEKSFFFTQCNNSNNFSLQETKFRLRSTRNQLIQAGRKVYGILRKCDGIRVHTSRFYSASSEAIERRETNFKLLAGQRIRQVVLRGEEKFGSFKIGHHKFNVYREDFWDSINLNIEVERDFNVTITDYSVEKLVILADEGFVKDFEMMELADYLESSEDD